MTDLFDTTQVRDDAAHWDALAERIASTAARESTRTGFDWFARSRTGWVAASVLLAAALAFMLLPTEDSGARGYNADWAQALAPADDVGRAITRPDGPPAIGALLLGTGSGGTK